MFAKRCTRISAVVCLIALVEPSQVMAWEALEETFTGPTLTDTAWTLTDDAALTAPSVDLAGDGWLRLTGAESNQRGVAYYDVAIPTDAGLIIDFEYVAWGGIGADGMTAFLFDGAIGEPGADPFQIGGWGGSLGYAQRCSSIGMAGGYVGIGFDEFGNYSNYRECRQGGSSGDLVPDAIAIRGSWRGGYAYLTGTTGSIRALDCPRWQCASRPQPGDPGHHSVRIAIVPEAESYAISVSLKAPESDLYEEIIPAYTLPDAPPPTLKFGYAASTGNSHNFHELRNLTIAAPTDLGVQIAEMPQEANAGERISFALEVENLGTQRASATLAQNSTAWLSDITVSCSPESACQGDDPDNIPIVLDAGERAEVLVTGTVHIQPTTQIHTASLTARGYELDMTNNDASATVEILPALEPPMLEAEDPDMGTQDDMGEDMRADMDEVAPEYDVIELLPQADMGEVDMGTDQGVSSADMEPSPPLEYSYAGQGCSASPRPEAPAPWALSILALLLLFASRTGRKQQFWVLASMLSMLIPQVATGQTVAYPQTHIEHFEPMPNQGANVLHAATTRLPEHLSYEVGVVAHYVSRPLVLGVRDHTPTVAIVTGQLKPELVASLGLFDRAELGVGIPYIAYQRGNLMLEDGRVGAPIGQAHMGDVRTSARIRLLDPSAHAGLGVGALAILHIPTGAPAMLTSDGSARVEGRMIADWQSWRGWRLGANLGYQSRRKVEALDAHFDDQIIATLYGDIGLLSRWRVRGALTSRASAPALVGRIARDESIAAPAEVTFALMRKTRYSIGWQAFGGWGIGEAPGAPAWRAGAGVTYRPTPKPKSACLHPVEDLDGFMDEDGCLDPDNDMDGIADIDDRCPDEAGVVSHDGCPAPEIASAPAQVEAPPVKEEAPPAQTCQAEPRAAPIEDTAREDATASKYIDLDERVYFDRDRDALEPRSEALLREVAAWMLEHPGRGNLVIEGYASTPGSRGHNLELSRRRALKVAMFLVQHGVPPERLRVYAFGEEYSHSKASAPLLGHQLEQRVDIRLDQSSIASSSSTSP